MKTCLNNLSIYNSRCLQLLHILIHNHLSAKKEAKLITIKILNTHLTKITNMTKHFQFLMKSLFPALIKPREQLTNNNKHLSKNKHYIIIIIIIVIRSGNKNVVVIIIMSIYTNGKLVKAGLLFSSTSLCIEISK